MSIRSRSPVNAQPMSKIELGTSTRAPKRSRGHKSQCKIAVRNVRVDEYSNGMEKKVAANSARYWQKRD